MSTQVMQDKNSWPRAFMLFLRDPQGGLMLKFLFGFGPVDLLDDVIPFLGQLDDPYFIVYPLVLLMTILRVRRYR